MDGIAADELTSPELEAIEDNLALNHDEFMELGLAWRREMQRKLAARSMRRRRAREAQLHSDLLAANEEIAS